MNVNGSRFHLFLGSADWADCLSNAAEPVRLGTFWAPESEPDPAHPWWSAADGEVTLAPVEERIPENVAEAPFTASARRDAAADRHGNIYHVADDGRGLTVRSAGSGATTRFWPPEPHLPPQAGRFDDAEPSAPDSEEVRAVAVLCADFLLAAVASAGGAALLRFDLVGGGSPDRLALPAEMDPVALAPAPAGGAWLLDRSAKRILRLDRDLAFVSREVPGEEPAFSAGEEAGQPPTRSEPVAVDASAAFDPGALAALGDGKLVLLDLSGAGQMFLLLAGASELTPLPPIDVSPLWITHDPEASDPTLLMADASGNRARRARLVEVGGQWRLALTPETLPLRRFGGRALVPVVGQVHYDSGAADPLWIPVVRRPHRGFVGDSAFLTPVRDGFEPQCEWDRVRLDGCIPASASVVIEARAADDREQLEASTAGGWIVQPAPVLSATGSELPGKRAQAMAPPDATKGLGTWELLLQGVTGRFAQLRLTLRGDGRTTPRLRALRLWYPRFSYAERFLPAVYRAEPASASFLTRFLANFEGVNTAIEDRIAAAEALFDPRVSPAERLDWLASWFEVALDAGWDEKRQRLFLANAARFFGWRGTVRGLKLALKLAAEPELCASDFELEGPEQPDALGIRIVEAFRRLPSSRRFGARAQQAPGPGAHPLALPWSPEEGSQGLWGRWAAAIGKPDAIYSGRFPLSPIKGGEAEWLKVVTDAFGFAPSAGAAEAARWHAFQESLGIAAPAPLPDREGGGEAWAAFAALPSRERIAWQRHLSERYRTLDRLNAAHGTAWTDFGEIPPPASLPATGQGVRDWLAFEGHRLPIEKNAHLFTVLLPRRRVDVSPAEEEARMARARRIVEIEKPAHTRFDIRFYWAMNRVGEARLGLDTEIGEGSRAPELIPRAILGRAFVGASFVGGPPATPAGRERLQC